MDFEVLIMGSDANAYYMARCYHEEYGKKAHLIGAHCLSFTQYTNILTIEYNKEIWEEKGFLQALKDYRKKHNKEKILLIASNETYAEFISKNRDKLKKDFYFNYPSIDIIKSLTILAGNDKKIIKLYSKGYNDSTKLKKYVLINKDLVNEFRQIYNYNKV